MRTGRSRPSLGERAEQSGVAGPSPADAAPPARTRREAGRHCWVHDPPEWPGTWPGLLVEWRQHPDGWHGRVAYTVAGPHGPVLVESWLPAARLEQR